MIFNQDCKVDIWFISEFQIFDKLVYVSNIIINLSALNIFLFVYLWEQKRVLDIFFLDI